MSGKLYDTIVLGAGGVGAAALCQLARRGQRVAGIDQFNPPHDRGSTHGETRVIRRAYFEHPDYVPLLDRAYVLWRELEEGVGQRLYHEVGLLQLGRPDGVVIPGVRASARRYGLDVETVAAADVARRFPGFRAADGMTGIFERGAGYLLVEPCVAAHLQMASRHGADLMTNCAVFSWRATGNGFAVVTDQGTFHSGSLAVCAGPWAGRMLDELALPLSVLRKPLFWFACTDAAYRESAGCPVWLYETGDGVFYGFPSIDGASLKAAEHSGGSEVDDPLALDRNLWPDDQNRLARILERYLPGVSSKVVGHQVCMYTMTPDHHFVIDRHPSHPGMVFAAGLSGHGFKFVSALGEAIADLIMDGRVRVPLEFLSIRRFGDPSIDVESAPRISTPTENDT